jgi:hypothetical protein
VRECATCGTSVAADARFCPECGRPLSGEEGGSGVPALSRRAWLRRASEPVLLAAAAALAVGVLLAMRGEWAWALVAVLVAAVAVLSLERLSGRTRSHPAVGLRARAAAAREALAARSREQLELFRARRELTVLEGDQDELLRVLGRAVYDEDDAALSPARRALDDVVARIAAKEAEIEAFKRETEERVGAAQASARPTERIETAPERVSDGRADAAREPASPAEEEPPR